MLDYMHYRMPPSVVGRWVGYIGADTLETVHPIGGWDHSVGKRQIELDSSWGEGPSF